MLIHPTLDKLHTLKCTGMAAALTEQMIRARYRYPQLRGTPRPARRPGDNRAGQPTHRQPAATRPTQTQCHPGGYRLSPPAGTG